MLKRFPPNFFLAVLLISIAACAQVTTQHNDNARTGAYLQEKTLNATNVNRRTFGRLFQVAVDGDVYAQVLYVLHLDIPGKGPRNVVYVATMHNMVYAIDADNRGGEILWSTAQPLAPPVPMEKNGDWKADCSYEAPNIPLNTHGETGIVGTPVISIDAGLIYLVTFTKRNASRDSYEHDLVALDLRTGQRVAQVKIAAKKFVSRLQNQRPALLLANQKVYVGFGSFSDCGPYHGFLFAYDANPKLWTQPPRVFNSTPADKQEHGAIWQAGQGPAADGEGNIYVITGNGGIDHDATLKGLGQSFVRLTANLVPVTRFTPWNADLLNDDDVDLGSGGPLLLPDTNLVIGAGKEGKLYVLNRREMGGFCGTPTCRGEKRDTQVVQEFQVTTARCPTFNGATWPNDGCGALAPAKGAVAGFHHLHGGPVYWNSYIYLWGEADYLKRYRFNAQAGKFNVKPDKSVVTTPTRSMPGAMLSLSADSSRASTAILWAAHPTGCTCNPRTQNCHDSINWCDANENRVPGTLRAIDASTLQELWNSEQRGSADQLGNVAKFTPVTIANGKVYVPTFSNQLVVYGLLKTK